jgi:hypothetical protein
MEEQFLAERYGLVIVLDSPSHRHLRLVRAHAPQASAAVDIVTWPGYLAVSSPMGAAMFRRTGDLLEMFREPEIACADDAALRRLADRLLAVDRHGVRSWREGLFRLHITRRVQDHIGAREIGPEMSSVLRDSVHDQIMARIKDGEQSAMAGALTFSGLGLSFTHAELRMHCFTWTTQFIWAVRAAIHCAQLYASSGHRPADHLETYRA